MAIALDSVSVGSGFGSNRTWAHTCSGDDRILLVSVKMNNGVRGDIVTAVTYAGQPLTRITFNNVQFTTFVYGIIAPATGANNIIVSFSGSQQSVCNGLSYIGVSQSGLPDASNIGSVSGQTTLPISLTTVADNCWAMIESYSSQTPSAGAGTTLRNVQNNGFVGDSNGVLTPAGLHSLAVNFSSANAGGSIVSFAPVSAPPPPSSLITTPQLLTLGCG